MTGQGLLQNFTGNKATLNPALRDFWLTPARNRVLYGGRSSSKTRDTSGFALFLAQQLNVRIMATRQFQSSVERSVYSVLVDQIDRFGLKKRFAITKTKIECPDTGSEFLFFGRARNTEEIKGTEDVDIHWAEESELMTAEEWRIIDATLKGEGSQHWIVFNPRFATDFVYKRFVMNPPADTVVRKINYDENPFLTETMLKVIEAAKLEDPEEFAHVYLGMPRKDDDQVIIKRSWIDAAINAHEKLGIEITGGKIGGFDVADEGPDSNALIARHGILVCHAEEWKDQDPNSAARHVFNEAIRMVLDEVHYDNIGVGAGAKGAIREEQERCSIKVRQPRFEGFCASAGVNAPEREYMPGKTNKDMFANIKAQAWWLLADRFRETFNAINGKPYDAEKIISLDPDLPHLDRLCAELSQPRREFSNGKFKVESKDTMKKRGVSSPNLADACVMAFAPECGFDIQSLL